MPIRWYECKKCGESVRAKQEPEHCGVPMQALLVAPQTKFMEKADPEKGKSTMVGQQKILRARARAHSRDVDMEELLENNDRKTAFENGWLKKDGTKRKRIDDL